MILLRLSLFTLLFGFGWSVQAVSISEVAWMGSEDSANHEWIELHNAGEAVVVDGWTLSDDVNLNIQLSGTVPNNSYVILERNRSDEGSVVGTPFLIYTGALVNTGATLTLRRGDGTIVDQVVGGEDWQNIGGDNTTKETAQYTSGGWVTAIPTPGTANTNTSASVVQTNETVSTTLTTAGSATVLTGNTIYDASSAASYAHLPWELDLSIVGPATVQVGQLVTFRAEANGLGPAHLNSLVYSWNVGDLTTGGTDKISHTYLYAGTYLVTLYATYANHEAVATKRVTVLPVQFSLARTNSGDVQLYNDASYDVDISGYRLQSGGKTIVFPPRSYLPARSTLTIPVAKIGSTLPVVLYDQQDNQLASTMTETATNHTSVSPPIRTPSPSPSPTTVTVPADEADDTSAFRFATDQPLTDATTNEARDIASTTDIDISTQQSLETIAPATTTNHNQTPSWPYGLLVVLLAVGVLALIAFPRPTNHNSS